MSILHISNTFGSNDTQNCLNATFWHFNAKKMEEEILVKTESCKVIYNKSGYLLIGVMGYFSAKLIRENALEVLNLAHVKECPNIIIDLTQMRGTWSYALKWLEIEFLPLIQEWKDEIKIAYICSTDSSSRQSLYRFFEISNEFDVQVFDQLEDSKRWLLNLPPREKEDTSLKVISIKNEGRHVIVEIESINYIWVEKKIVHIETLNSSYECRSSLKDILQKLPENFQQIHRSYAVNLNQVASIKYYAGGSYLLYLKRSPNIKIPVGRTFAPSIKKRLGIKVKW